MYVAEEGGYCDFLTRQAGRARSEHTYTYAPPARLAVLPPLVTGADPFGLLRAARRGAALACRLTTPSCPTTLSSSLCASRRRPRAARRAAAASYPTVLISSPQRHRAVRAGTRRPSALEGCPCCAAPLGKRVGLRCTVRASSTCRAPLACSGPHVLLPAHHQHRAVRANGGRRRRQ